MTDGWYEMGATGAAQRLAWSSEVQGVFAEKVARLRLIHTAGISVPHATLTTIPWNSALVDTHTLWQSGTTITFGASGFVVGGASLRYQENNTGFRGMRVYRNATPISEGSAPGAGNVYAANAISIAFADYFAAGDTLLVDTQHNAGSSLPLVSRGGGYQASLGLIQLPA